MPIAAMSMTGKNTGKWHRTFKGEWLNNPSCGSLTEPATEEDWDTGVHWKLPGPRLRVTTEQQIQHSQEKALFKIFKSNGVFTEALPKQRGDEEGELKWDWNSQPPRAPAVERPSWKGFLSGGRATPTEGCTAKGRGTPRGWVFLVYNPTSKWQSFASHVVQGGRAFPMQPKLASNLQQFSGLSRPSSKITGMSHHARLNKLQIKQTIFWKIIL